MGDDFGRGAIEHVQRGVGIVDHHETRRGGSHAQHRHTARSWGRGRMEREGEEGRKRGEREYREERGNKGESHARESEETSKRRQRGENAMTEEKERNRVQMRWEGKTRRKGATSKKK